MPYNINIKDWLNYKKVNNLEYMKEDKVNHPHYYCSHPSGYECIDITEHYDFCVGNAIKYLWRAGLKCEEGYTNVEKEIEDLKKAAWYINRKIKYLEDIINKSKLVE